MQCIGIFFYDAKMIANHWTSKGAAMGGRAGGGFARQQWRAWIETRRGAVQQQLLPDSPASNGGRGLKQAIPSQTLNMTRIRPPAMAGVD